MKTSPRRVLFFVAAAELLTTSLWFSGTVVLPQLTQLWQADLNVTAWVTMAVQLGFVVGGLVSALFNLADVVSAPRLFAFAALGGAAANAAFAAVAADNIPAALTLRFLTGATSAPP